jgi:uncharacterized protein (TIGR03437 family)
MKMMRLTLAVWFAAAGALSGQSLQIVTTSLPGATTNTQYQQQLTTSGGTCQGTGTATSAIDSGSLPPGLTVTSPAGVEQWTIQGVPNTAGTYNFTLHISWTLDRRTPFVQPCTDDAVKALSIVVTTGQPPATLSVDRPQVSTTFRVGHFPPLADTVQVSSGGATSVSFTTQSTTASGGNWLSVSPPSGVTPAPLTLTYSPSGLTPGVYTGTVTIAPASGAAVTVAVTLSVILDSQIVLAATPASFTFTSLNGAPAPAPQTLKVAVTGDNVLFSADVTTAFGKWLTVSPSGSATPAQLTVSVDPKGLAVGSYSGTITLHVPGVTNSTTVVPVTYSIQSQPVVPAITANGVVNNANSSAAIAPGTWVSIFGANLSDTSRPWANADFVGGKLPLALDGVSVTIDGKAAAVAYVSPTQLNVLAPDDPATGLVFVQVKNATGTSDNAIVLQQTAAPAFFQFGNGKPAYVAGTHADNSYLAGTALIQQGIPGTPAKPGETIVLYGTGFGTTQPAISATALVPTPLPLANPSDLRIRVGGVDSQIVFAGLIAPGLYQFNIVVPQVNDGDQTIVAELRGLLTRSDLMLTVQH